MPKYCVNGTPQVVFPARRYVLAMPLTALLAGTLAFSGFCYAQTAKPENPKSDATASQAQPCVIVKRHVHKFGENMSRFHPHRPFDYVEGDYPSGFKWRSELSNGDVRELQKKVGR
jgi:hypothetical protein